MKACLDCFAGNIIADTKKNEVSIGKGSVLLEICVLLQFIEMAIVLAKVNAQQLIFLGIETLISDPSRSGPALAIIKYDRCYVRAHAARAAIDAL